MNIKSIAAKMSNLSEQPHSPGFRRTFARNRLTLGFFFPLGAYPGDTPDLERQAEFAAMADQGGFSALWTRDVPLQDPTFGDLGQVLDPFVWMGYMLNHIKQATLATGSLILPLRHPIHVAKAAASLENLSSGGSCWALPRATVRWSSPRLGKSISGAARTFRNPSPT